MTAGFAEAAATSAAGAASLAGVLGSGSTRGGSANRAVDTLSGAPAFKRGEGAGNFLMTLGTSGCGRSRATISSTSRLRLPCASSSSAT